jgi:hypothetical protein
MNYSIVFRTRVDNSSGEFIKKAIEIKNVEDEGETPARSVAIEQAIKQLRKEGFETRLPDEVTHIDDAGEEIVHVPTKLAA